MTPVALGFRAGRGGSVVVGVATDRSQPRVVLSTFLATAAEGDRLAFEPYKVAYELPRRGDGGPSVEAAATVAEGRKRQAALATTGLGAILDRLKREGHRPIVAALLINRAGWMTDQLEHCLSSPEHPPVAEGLAVRAALRIAFDGLGLDYVEMDEKSLRESATLKLPLSPGQIDGQITALGAAAGRLWRKGRRPLVSQLGRGGGVVGRGSFLSAVSSGASVTVALARRLSPRSRGAGGVALHAFDYPRDAVLVRLRDGDRACAGDYRRAWSSPPAAVQTFSWLNARWILVILLAVIAWWLGIWDRRAEHPADGDDRVLLLRRLRALRPGAHRLSSHRPGG